MADGFKNAATRAAFSAAIDGVLRYVNKDEEDREKAFNKLIDLAQKFLGDTFQSKVFDSARELVKDPDSKWMRFINCALNELDPHVIKMNALNLGYQAGFYGFKKTQALKEELGCNVPWIILMDPTSACNLHCTGCWAAEYGNRLNLSYEDLDSIVTQGKELGIYFYMMTGGEPLVRKDDIIKLCKKHKDCAFHAFTNGTLIDEKFCKEAAAAGNITFSLSLEGFEEVNDGRRGNGIFAKVMDAMDLMKAHGLLFGTSICYTSANYKTVTSDEFLKMIISKGVRFTWYFHYMPVGNDASVDLLPTKEQREYMYHRIRELRTNECDLPIFAMDFQNDGEYVGGCIAGGRFYAHINPNGDVEPCVFIHYSSANIHDMSLLDCFKQPLFMEYKKNQPFNENHLRPCPMLENPEKLTEMVEKTGAHSTDLQSPETAEHLCDKCEAYANCWKDEADELWKNSEDQRKKRKSSDVLFGK